MDEYCSRRRYVRSIGATAVGVALAGCGGGGGDGGGGGNTVEMTDDLVFDPDSITVDLGEAVTWENVGSATHTVTAYEDDIPDGAAYFASGGFESEGAARDAWSPGDPESGNVAGGESFEHTFETAGTYRYFCIPPESAGMQGSVAVREG